MNTIGKKIESTGFPDPNVLVEGTGEVLGSLGGEADSSGIRTGAGAKDLLSARKKDVGEERLVLPKGALVILRKSGGLRFTSQTVAVHRDGQVRHSSKGSRTSKIKGVPRKLSNGQLGQIKIAVAKVGLNAPLPKIVTQSPDAYAYEIVAQSGRKQIAIEVFDGSTPDAVKPLIRALNALMPKG